MFSLVKEGLGGYICVKKLDKDCFPIGGLLAIAIFVASALYTKPCRLVAWVRLGGRIRKGLRECSLCSELITCRDK